MKKTIIVISLLLLLAVPCSAVEHNAPTAPPDASLLLPAQTSDFGSDLWYVFTSAISALLPHIAETARTCVRIFAVVIFVSIMKDFSDKGKNAVSFAGTLSIVLILLQQSGSAISLASDTVAELSNYGKLLLPIMTTTMATQGSMTSSAAIYTATTIFNSLLSGAINDLLVPLVYVYLIASSASAATGEKMLSSIRDSVKGLVTWCLKMIIYIFTGYMSITGVVSGTTDATVMKATKLTMSGMIPVVGGILSDASESVLVSAALVKNAAGVYGMLALIAIWITPFLRIGVVYLLLKFTAALSKIFDAKPIDELVGDFSGAMGLLLGMTGAVCILLLISTVCFMKGITW